MFANGLSSELYIRVTMSGGHGQNHNFPNTYHHFYVAYGSDEEDPDHYANRLNQDLDKAQDFMMKPIEDLLVYCIC